MYRLGTTASKGRAAGQLAGRVTTDGAARLPDKCLVEGVLVCKLGDDPGGCNYLSAARSSFSKCKHTDMVV
jgi:hypothetical protein